MSDIVKSPGRATKSNKATLIKRREDVQECILKGNTNTQICEILSEKWNTSIRAISEDIILIRKHWQEQEEENKNLNRNKFLQRLELMLASAIERKDLKTALAIQQEIHKLTGMYQETKTDEAPPKIINLSRREPVIDVENHNDK
jgi:hypothetical protein